MFVLFSCCCSFSCKKQFCDRSQGPPPGASGGVGAFTPNMFSFLYCASFIVCRKHNVVGTVRIVMFQTTLCVGITVGGFHSKTTNFCKICRPTIFNFPENGYMGEIRAGDFNGTIQKNIKNTCHVI